MHESRSIAFWNGTCEVPNCQSLRMSHNKHHKNSISLSIDCVMNRVQFLSRDSNDCDFPPQPGHFCFARCSEFAMHVKSFWRYNDGWLPHCYHPQRRTHLFACFSWWAVGFEGICITIHGFARRFSKHTRDVNRHEEWLRIPGSTVWANALNSSASSWKNPNELLMRTYFKGEVGSHKICKFLFRRFLFCQG